MSKKDLLLEDFKTKQLLSEQSKFIGGRGRRISSKNLGCTLGSDGCCCDRGSEDLSSDPISTRSGGN